MSRNWMSAVVGLYFGLVVCGDPVAASEAADGVPPQAAAAAPSAAGGGRLPSPKKVVIVIEENKGYSYVIGSPSSPYTYYLASRDALLANFSASRHPNQANYVHFFADQVLGVCDDICPSAPFTADNLGTALSGANKSLGRFAENLPSHQRTACKSRGGTCTRQRAIRRWL